MSIGPSLRSTASRAGFSVLRCETSSLRAIAGTPVFSSCASVSRLRSSLRARIATDAPASARPSAIPRPMPPLPPVTTATLPLKSNDFGLAIALLLHGPMDSECLPLLYWRFARVATERLSGAPWKLLAYGRRIDELREGTYPQWRRSSPTLSFRSVGFDRFRQGGVRCG